MGRGAWGMNNQPFLTIIVPVYNAEKTVAACIESLLEQDYPAGRYEVIVVDNGSVDRDTQLGN
jgi:glycosyltransferase involved in cell wall biosynthesis